MTATATEIRTEVRTTVLTPYVATFKTEADIPAEIEECNLFRRVECPECEGEGHLGRYPRMVECRTCDSSGFVDRLEAIGHYYDLPNVLVLR